MQGIRGAELPPAPAAAPDPRGEYPFASMDASLQAAILGLSDVEAALRDELPDTEVAQRFRSVDHHLRQIKQHVGYLKYYVGAW